MEEKKKYIKPEAEIFILFDIDTDAMTVSATADWETGEGEDY